MIDVAALAARIHKENRQQLRIAVIHAIAMLCLAVIGNWFLMRVAVGVLAVVRAVAAGVILRHDRAVRAVAALPAESAGESLIDLQARFVRGVKYWYGFPLAFGLVLAGVAFWHHAHSLVGVALCAFVTVTTVVGTYQLNDVRWIADLEALRSRRS